MLQGVWEHFQALFGLGDYAAHAGAVQIALRTVLVYVSTLAIVRLGSKRFLSKATAFDVIVAIMLGSIMSRAVDAASPFFPTVLVAGTMLALHWLLGVLAYRVGWFGSLVKGTRTLLIKDGQIQWKGMRQRSITHNDLTQALRTQTKQTDPRKIQLAYQERDGDISVVPYKQEPRILDVSVRDGVQTVRIELQ
jgi:uncharacterized membrane protein YcaP (DUF421 family)